MTRLQGKESERLTEVGDRSGSRDSHVRESEQPGVPVLNSLHESFLVGESSLGTLGRYESKNSKSSLLSTEELGVVREIGEDEEGTRSDDD